MVLAGRAMEVRCISRLGLFLLLLGLSLSGARGGQVRVGTFNVENYLLTRTDSRVPKSEASKAKVAESLATLAADVVGLQEVGGSAALADLRARLARAGLDYAHSRVVHGFDTNIQVALLSRFPVVGFRAHTNDAFLVAGQRFRVSRGFLEAEIELAAGERMRVFVAHLKSRRTIARADEAAIRLEEARVLRRWVETRLKDAPRERLVVLGDLNDTPDREPIRLLVGRGRTRLTDTRPSEWNGDRGVRGAARGAPRTVAWTHHYAAEDTYSRVDYVLLSARAADERIAEASGIPRVADWGVASDHRPLVVTLRWGPASP